MLRPFWNTAQMVCGVWLLLFSCSLHFSPSVSELAFSTLPNDAVGKLNQPLMLHCAAYDSSLEKILPVRWERLSGGLDMRIHQMPNGSLFFPSLQEEDIGAYVCSARRGPNHIGTIVNVSQANLEPVFFSPQSQIVSEGQDVFLQCVSGDSSPPAQITWLKNGQLVSIGTQIQGQYGGGNQRKTSGTLYIANITKADEGTYICVTHNSLLDKEINSTPATVKVKGSASELEILQGPKNTTVAVETEAVMRCVVQGFPLPMVQWFKNNQLLLNTSSRSLHDDGQLLVFEKVLHEDEGWYHCEARNEKGTVTSQPAFLLPADMEWNFMRQPANVTAKTGDPVTLVCRPPHSRPAAKISWFKNNQLLQSMSHFTLELNGDLIFQRVHETDRGSYFCRASNVFLQRMVTSRKIYLEVLVPPSVTIWPAVVTAPVGSEVMIYCQVSGHPVPSIEWSKQGQSVLTGAKVTTGVRNSTLYISALRFYDEGLYMCKASNSVGQDQRTSILHVAVKPVIISFVESMSVSEGSNVILPCLAVGVSPISYTWSRKVFHGPFSPLTGMPVDDKGTLRISSVNQSDTGEYHCTAENQIGQDQRSGFLTVTAEDISQDQEHLNKPVVTGVPSTRIRQTINLSLHHSKEAKDKKMTGTLPQPLENISEFSVLDAYLKDSPTHSITVPTPESGYTQTLLNDSDGSESKRAELHKNKFKAQLPLNPSSVYDAHTQPADHITQPSVSQTTHRHPQIVPPNQFVSSPTQPAPYTQTPNPLYRSTDPLSQHLDLFTQISNPHTESTDHYNQPSTLDTQTLQESSQDSLYLSSSNHTVVQSNGTKSNFTTSVPEQTEQNHSLPVESTKSAEAKGTDQSEWPKKNSSQSPMRTTEDNARVRKQSPTWLPVLEKHDIPIVVGVGVSLAFIFITMAFYSLVQKNDPSAPTGRAALRNLGGPCRYGDRLMMERTYENRAFEDDNFVAVIEQSPNTSETRAQPPLSTPSNPELELSCDNVQEEVQSIQCLPVIVETHPEPSEEDQIETSLEEGKGTTSPHSEVQLQCVEDWRSQEFGPCQDAPLPSPPNPPLARDESVHSSVTLQTTEPCSTPVRHNVNISHGSTPLLLSHCVSMGMTSVAVDVHFYPSATGTAGVQSSSAVFGQQVSSRLAQHQDHEQTAPTVHHYK